MKHVFFAVNRVPQAILPALLVGSGLKRVCNFLSLNIATILPALLVGSGLKLICLLPVFPLLDSPGFISREWIETKIITWETECPRHSPGFISREWIETAVLGPVLPLSWILPALLVGSGLKRIRADSRDFQAEFSRLY